jgi:hypothetical protein
MERGGVLACGLDVVEGRQRMVEQARAAWKDRDAHIARGAAVARAVGDAERIAGGRRE